MGGSGGVAQASLLKHARSVLGGSDGYGFPAAGMSVLINQGWSIG
jgi:hypothetical protein